MSAGSTNQSWPEPATAFHHAEEQPTGHRSSLAMFTRRGESERWQAMGTEQRRLAVGHEYSIVQ